MYIKKTVKGDSQQSLHDMIFSINIFGVSYFCY